MLKACVQNNIKFRTIIADTWYSAAETMTFIVEKIEAQTLPHPRIRLKMEALSFCYRSKATVKSPHLSEQEKEQGQYKAVSFSDTRTRSSP